MNWLNEKMAKNYITLIGCLAMLQLSKLHSIQADDQIERTTSTDQTVPLCQPPIDLTVDASWLETIVFGRFRVWHIIFSGGGAVGAILVVLCCLFRCRIPRTKQEIEADFIRKEITDGFRTHLNKIKLEELQYDPENLLSVFKRVQEMEGDRVKRHQFFAKRKLTWSQKIKKFLTGRDISSEELNEEVLDAQADEQSAQAFVKMTKEQMDLVEKQVESVRVDLNAFNVINDQIAILSYFESDKARKKRQKEAEKQIKQEQKNKDKIAKTEARKKLVELKAENIEKDTEKMKKNDEEKVFAIDIEQKKLDESEASKFSFKNTVKSLMYGKFLKSEKKKQEAMIINIELVSRPSSSSCLVDEQPSQSIDHQLADETKIEKPAKPKTKPNQEKRKENSEKKEKKIKKKVSEGIGIKPQKSKRIRSSKSELEQVESVNPETKAKNLKNSEQVEIEISKSKSSKRKLKLREIVVDKQRKENFDVVVPVGKDDENQILLFPSAPSQVLPSSKQKKKKSKELKVKIMEKPQYVDEETGKRKKSILKDQTKRS